MFWFLLEYALHQNCHYYSANTKQFNEFQYQNTHQELLHKSNPFFILSGRSSQE